MENEVTRKPTDIIILHEQGSLLKLSSQPSNSLEPWGKDRGKANALGKMCSYENVVKIFSADKIKIFRFEASVFHFVLSLLLCSNLRSHWESLICQST